MLQSVARSRLLPFSVAAAAAAWGYSASEPAGFAASAEQSDGALSPKEFRDLKLTKKEKLTHNSYHLRFELPGGASANMPVASCLLTKASLQGPGDDKPKVIIRPYTPVSAPDAAGYLDLVIKAYPTGKMSKHLGDLKVGESVAFKGPIPKYPYTANTKKEIGMVAGGTGITPMLQVADHILNNPADKTKVSLVFANMSEGDILLKDKIDGMAAKHPDRFKVYYIVDKPNWGGIFWKGGVGYVTRDMLATHMPAPSLGSDALIMVCGPPGMMNAVSGDKAQDKSQGELIGLLKAMGYSADQVYKF
jgi:cytochrome-b5 reductase